VVLPRRGPLHRRNGGRHHGRRWLGQLAHFSPSPAPGTQIRRLAVINETTDLLAKPLTRAVPWLTGGPPFPGRVSRACSTRPAQPSGPLRGDGLGRAEVARLGGNPQVRGLLTIASRWADARCQSEGGAGVAQTTPDRAILYAQSIARDSNSSRSRSLWHRSAARAYSSRASASRPRRRRTSPRTFGRR
jgi:hypothetical protein